MRTHVYPRLLVGVAVVLAPGLARSEGPQGSATKVASEAAEPAPAAPPAPYSLPWQLRPAQAVNVVRWDTSSAHYAPAANADADTLVSTLLLARKVTPTLAPLLRVGVVYNAPATGSSGTTFANPVVGAIWAPKLDALGKDLRLSTVLAAALPLGMGGGDTPDASEAASNKAAIGARTALDNAMFAVNDLVLLPGADLAYVKGGFTVQVEVTLLELIRMRGSKVQKDEARTNFTSGLHLGYFVVPELSFGGELRYQRWLSTPAAVAADKTGASRDNLSAALGARFHIAVADKVWLRPGVAYVRGLDDPLDAQGYQIIQLDVPLIF